MTRKKAKVNPDLEDAINKLLEQVMGDPTSTLTDKTKILDRALKWEAIKLKALDEDWGAGLFNSEEEA